MKLLSFFILFYFLPLQSCSTGKNAFRNQTQWGHHELYSLPSSFEENQEKKNQEEENLFFLLTSELPKEKESTQERVFDKKNESILNVRSGGQNIFSKYIKIFKDTFKERSIVISSGNFSDDSSSLIELATFYKNNPFDLIALGNHELNLKPVKKVKANIENFTKDLSEEVLLGNIFDLSKSNKIEWKNVVPYTIKTFKGIKLGFIHAISPELLSTDFVTQNPYYAQHIYDSILKTIQTLRGVSVSGIILIADTKIDCSTNLKNKLKLPIDKINFDPRSKIACTNDSEIERIINALPSGSIDLVLLANSGERVENFIKDTPVLRTKSGGKYMSLIKLTFNKEEKKFNQYKTHFLGTVKACEDFISTTNDCYTKEDIKGGEIIKAKFLGVEI